MSAEAAYIHFGLLYPETLDQHPVDPAWFSSPTHRRALKALRILHEHGRGTPAELEAIVGKGYYASLPKAVDMPYTPSALPGVLRDAAQRRTIAEALETLSADLKVPTLSTQERLALAVGKLLEAQEQAEQVDSFEGVMRETLERVEKVYKTKGLLGIPTGWEKLDEIIGGWEPQKLYFVSARPGAGKTSFGLQAITEAGKQGRRVYVSSQEMGKTQVGIRLLSQEGQVSSERLRTGGLYDGDWPKVTGAAGELQRIPGWIDTRTGVSFDQLRGSILRHHAKEPVEFVLVDYVQMMRGVGENKVYELEHIAYGLKGLAKEINAPILALSQLNRGAEEDERKPPKLSQMRGSGGLEQAADVVIILWAPDKKEPNRVEMRIAKHRDGRTGKIDVVFQREWARFA